ncbi:Wadjet anti-phage system protein JetD domain-containing protein [Glutamicibacter endophyticus]|uniref:Wadjet anti-phage system protein JetD domain-containing protein n=1 Tax=Glutamicibacter endophyticus TaxID=1522174 RepID=UPI003AF10FA1
MTADIERRMKTRWHEHLTGVSEVFPHAFPLGRPTTAELRADYATIHAGTLEWRDWARHHGVELVYENRVAKGGSTQVIPTHVKVPGIDRAAAIVGGDWPDRLARGRERFAVLGRRYPHVNAIDRVLRHLDRYSNLDFTLLTTVADWFLADPSRSALGVTPRQVPVPGVHAKWLQSHFAGVQALTGLDDLGILPAHPPRIHFTYLDPDHRASGARVHDSATVGDAFEPVYMPKIVIISENKDTAIHFPPLAGGIAVEGVGKGGKTPAAFPWIRRAPILVYWGDIDRDGYEILDGYRRDFSRDIASILMDPNTYETYEQFGTDLDPYGRSLPVGNSKSVDLLHADERSVYTRLLDKNHSGHRRIEQERIPLDRALEAVIELGTD